MASAVFDTLSFSRKLVDAGIDQRQADAITGAVHDAVAGSVVTQPAMEHALDRTRAELHSALDKTTAELSSTLDRTKAELHSALDKTKAELRLEIQAVRASLMTVQWMTGAIVAGVLALVAKSFF